MHSRVQLKGVTAALVVATLAACADPATQPDGAVPTAADRPLAAVQQAEDDAVVAGEVIVKMKDGASLDDLARGNGVAKGRRGHGGHFDVVHTGRGNERAMAARLANDPRVEFAEPNYIRQHHAIDSRMWAFVNPGGLNMNFSDPADSRFGTPIPASYASLLDADQDAIEGIATTGANVTIGSLDTGVDFTHPEFAAGSLIAGRDWFAADNDPSDTPDEGHGTHTIGTMVGQHVGVAGVTGAASRVKVLVQRVCGPGGCPTSAIVNAINAAADYVDANGQRLVAINLSLGGRTISTAEKNAILRATNNGVLVIASAGNSGTSKVACPACDPNAISVSATDWRDALAAYSQYGSGLDIAAPGGYCYSNTTPEGCILSAVPQVYTAAAPVAGPIAGANYDWYNGTSMAAPQVTGTAAVVASVTGLRGKALRTRLESTADDRGTAGYDTKFGAGRLNTYRAVKGTALPAGQ